MLTCGVCRGDCGCRRERLAVWPYGRTLFTKRLMGLTWSTFRAVAPVDGLAIRVEAAADLLAVLTVDTVAFKESADVVQPWLELLLAHPAVTVAIADHNGQPVATGHVTLSSGWAGPAAYLGWART